MKKIIDTLDNDTNAGLVIVDRGMVIRHVNARMAQWTGVSAEQLLGASFALTFPACAAALEASLLDAQSCCPHGRGAVDNGLPAKGLIQIPTPTGAIECMVCFPFTDIDDELSHAALFYDARDAEAFHRSFGSAINRLLRLQVEQQLLLLKLEHKDDHLLEVEKLAGIGQLAAGIAHEINNPIGYIFSNLRTLASYVREMLNLIDAVDTVNSLDEFRQLRNCPEYEYIRSDVESLISESEEGIDRVKKIIGALKDFSHPEEPGYRPVDLHRCIETTLKVIANEVKYKAEAVKVYARDTKRDGRPSGDREMTRATLLLVDDEAAVTSSLKRALRLKPYDIIAVQDGAAALEILASQTIDRIISDSRMPGMAGPTLLAEAQRGWPDTMRVLLTGQPYLGATIEAINNGKIYRYISKPWDEREPSSLPQPMPVCIAAS